MKFHHELTYWICVWMGIRSKPTVITILIILLIVNILPILFDSVKNTILHTVRDALQTSYKVDDIDIVFYIHKFIQHFFIQYTIIILFYIIAKCDPVHTIHNNIALTHVFYLLNDLAQWFLM